MDEKLGSGFKCRSGSGAWLEIAGASTSSYLVAVQLTCTYRICFEAVLYIYRIICFIAVFFTIMASRAINVFVLARCLLDCDVEYLDNGVITY